jgi:Flp pilus assembly protein TadD
MPSDAGALGLARHFLEVQRPERALEALGRAASEELETQEFWSLRAEALLRLNRPDQGAAAAREGITRYPDDFVLLDLLALCELDRGNKAGAREAIERALDLEPDHPHVLAHRAIVLAASKRRDEAQEALARASAIAPDDPQVASAGVLVAIQGRDRRRAKAFSQRLIEQTPSDHGAHVMHGAAEAELGHIERAAHHLSRAVELNPRNDQVAEAAYELRMAAKPVFAPIRLIYRIGRFRSWALYVVLVIVLRAAGYEELAYPVIAVWLVACVVTWIGPPLVRWHYRRRVSS